jgi:hypothetical protein
MWKVTWFQNNRKSHFLLTDINNMKITVFWDVMPCNLVGSYQHFGETYFLLTISPPENTVSEFCSLKYLAKSFSGSTAFHLPSHSPFPFLISLYLYYHFPAWLILPL